MGKSKDVTINGHEFQISSLGARDGSWVASLFEGGRMHDPEFYNRIVDMALQKVVLYQDINGVRTPQLFYTNGKFLVPKMGFEEDTDTIHELVFGDKGVLEFSCGPTLRRILDKYRSAIAKQQESTTAPNLSPPASTDTSGAQ